jgi:hypothetical protein
MLSRIFLLSFAALLSILSSEVSASPMPAPMAVGNGLTQVYMRCNPERCIDPQTGEYSQSTCDANGCRPLGGIVGHPR